jgi:radical SAM/Cys-rich protein
MKSLNAQQHPLSNSRAQLDVLSQTYETKLIRPFQHEMDQHGLYPLKPIGVSTFQVNLGKMCNQTCGHCHVDAGPDRKEIMTQETMGEVLEAIDRSSAKIVDLTGGAPEMNPHFRWFVEECSQRGLHIINRCNLTIIVANKKYQDLPEFFKQHRVEVVSSLPFYSASKTDKQRGDGVFEKSITALNMLNAVGYGKPESGLILNLVYNPNGAFLPAGQAELEQKYKRELARKFGIEFNALFAITNIPISRFLDFLIASGNYQGYMEKLANSFNPTAAKGVMCRDMISISWDGFVYDCDFNQMLDLKVMPSGVRHIRDFNEENLLAREIVLQQHCYGCTAGAGSSCGGNTV